MVKIMLTFFWSSVWERDLRRLNPKSETLQCQSEFMSKLKLLKKKKKKRETRLWGWIPPPQKKIIRWYCIQQVIVTQKIDSVSMLNTFRSLCMIGGSCICKKWIPLAAFNKIRKTYSAIDKWNFEFFIYFIKCILYKKKVCSRLSR